MSKKQNSKNAWSRRRALPGQKLICPLQSLFDSHVQLQVPAKLSPVTNDIWVLKYHDRPKSMLALSDEYDK
jgi:hypothetical protein